MGRRQRTALVTGTTSGIGRAIAELLARRGYRVYAGMRVADSEDVRPPTKLGEGWLEPVRLDVTSDADATALMNRLHGELPDGLDALINNAGIGAPAALELTTHGEVRRLLEVNALGPLRLIQACLPLLRRARGRIICMSSMNGSIALPMVGAYSASKFALEAYCDCLRVELRPWGIKVSVIRPGQVRTPIFLKAREALQRRSEEVPIELASGYGRLYEKAAQFNERGAKSSTSPEDVARKVLQVLEMRSPAARYLVGLDAWGLQLAKMILPTRLLDRVLARASGALAGKPHPENRSLSAGANESSAEDRHCVAPADAADSPAF